jgi:hypothetical protein
MSLDEYYGTDGQGDDASDGKSAKAVEFDLQDEHADSQEDADDRLRGMK